MTDKQKHLLQLLREIDGICKKHGLRYVMAGGSLIGAVRHEGFVPWDDDVDIYMPRDDWNALVELSGTEFPPDRAVQCVDVDRSYTNTFPRYADTSSCAVHRHQIIGKDKAGEILDVLTLDPIPPDDREYEKYRTYMMIYSELVNVSAVYGARWEISAFTYLRYLLSSWIFGRDRTLAKLEKLMFSYKEEDCSRYAMRWGGCPFLFDRDMMFPVKYMKFEDLEVMVPARVSDYLIWHYGDEWSYIPGHGERTSHDAVSVEGLGYEEFRREYLPGLSPAVLRRNSVVRKFTMMLLAKRSHRLMKHRLELCARCTEMDLNASLKKSGADVAALLRERRFGELSEIFSEYFRVQCDAAMIGREDFRNIYPFYHPVLVKVDDGLFLAAVTTLFYTERVGKAFRLLQVREKLQGLKEETQRLREDILRFRRAVCLYELRELPESERMTEELLERYPGHPGLLKLRCRFVMERARERGMYREAREFFQEAGKYCPGDGYFLKYEGDLLRLQGREEEALRLYAGVKEATKNGIVYLELDQFYRERKGAAAAQIRRLAKEGDLTGGRRLLELWQALLPEDAVIGGAGFYLEACGETADKKREALLKKGTAALTRMENGEEGVSLAKELYLDGMRLLLKGAGYSEALCGFYLEMAMTEDGAQLEEILERLRRYPASDPERGAARKLEGDILLRQGHTDEAFGRYREALEAPLPPFMRQSAAGAVISDWYYGARKAADFAKKGDAGEFLDHWLGKYGGIGELKALARRLFDGKEREWEIVRGE